MGKHDTDQKIESGFKKLKDRIRSKRYSGNPIVRFTVERLFDCASFLHIVKGLLTDKQYRAVFAMKLFHPGKVHQTTPATALNRYPVIFSACRDYFEGRHGIRILSFGCSTGEEVITLRDYFLDAVIIGAEINKHSLEICRKRRPDDKMIFIESTDEEIKRNGPYDAVFCMAVFQREPHQITEKGITDLSGIYPFSKFEKQVCALDQYVREGGLMVVHFSQYDFRDTRAASKYRVYGDYNQDSYEASVFDKNCRLITGNKRRYSIFVKNVCDKNGNQRIK